MKGKKFVSVLGEVTARAVSAWFTAISLTLILRPGDASYIEYSVENLRFTLWAGAISFAVFSVPGVLRHLGRLKFAWDFWLLMGSTVLFACVAAYKFLGIFFSVGAFIAVIAVASVCFARGRGEIPDINVGKKASLWILGVGGGVMTCFIASVCIVRYVVYYAPTYDFGIFANMFDNMLETGLPLTTCERDGLTSHFSVHISPIYYLILPLYALCPRPETLLVIQAAAVVSGCVPIWLIARKKTGSYAAAAVFSVVYLLYPAFSCGAYFDFHENKFLAPLILWALWFCENKKRIPMYLFLLFTAMVKEDASVYTAVVGLYMFFGKKERLHGALVFGGSLAYFFGAVALLGHIGEGGQFWRYGNIASGSLTDIITAVFLNPMRVVSECVGEDKVKFIFQMLFPLLGLPLFSKKASRYFLLIPFVLVNLMPDYVYQHDIGYQYTFGSGALLFYLAILNWTDLRESLKPGFVKKTALAICTAAMLSFMAYGARGGIYFSMALEDSHITKSIRSALDIIPEDATVCASTMFVAHLADCEEIYDMDSNFRLTDYVAVDLRNMNTEEMDTRLASIEAMGYDCVVVNPHSAAVLRKR